MANAWEVGRVPPNFWSKIENQRNYLNWLAKKHNVTCLDDWYKVPSRAFPIQLLKIYQNYHSHILSTHFPECEWLEWKFVRTPHNFWISNANRRRYLDWLGDKLGFINLEDWYQITGDDFRRNYGESLLARYYKNSYQRAVIDILNEFEWKEWLFESVPDGFWSESNNQKRFLNWLGEKLGYEKLEDWYGLTHEILTRNNGYGIYHKAGSVSEVVKVLYPRADINEWQFTACSRSFWKVRDNRRRYLDWLGKRLGFRKMEDWYKVTAQDFYENYGAGLLKAYYKGSPSAVLIDVYDEFQWHKWLFTSAPQSFWKKKENRRHYLNWLGEKLGFTDFEDWYTITVNDFQKNHGIGLLNCYSSSPTQVIMDVLEEYDWDLAKFYNRPQAYWQNSQNRQGFLEHLFKKLGYRRLDDWYKATHEDFTNNGGNGLLNYYRGSHIKVLIENYPGHNWLEWKFVSTPQKFWRNTLNRKKYMIWLGEQLGFSELDDWYKISIKGFELNYGLGLLHVSFGGSPVKAVVESFPEHIWCIWMFKVVPQGFWQIKRNRKNYIDWLGNRLGIKNFKEWYEITKNRFVENYGSGFLDYYNNSCALAVLDCYSDYDWEIENFSQRRANQKRIYRILREIYPDAKWQYKHPNLRFKKTGAKMELDIWIPSMNIAIEYQGEQHFFPVKGWGGEPAFRQLQKRDQEKRDACKVNGIKMIEIPYTWDGDKKSLLEQIQKVLKA